jgi:rhomboid protease GluP
VSQPLTLRTEVGDEDLDLAEFEARVRRGDISPQCLVRLPAVTGEGFVPACELELWRALHEPRRAYFARAFAMIRFPWLTTALIFFNLGLHLWTVRGGPLDMDAMVRFGGKAAPLILDLGEVWRLLTANFLHWNLLHLGVNMFVLFNVGGALENAYRRLDYLFLLVLSGICTMALSLWISPQAVTVGASGMVYGCLGGVVIFGLKYRTILPSGYRRILGEAAIPIVLLLFLMGFVSPGVDNAAHLGGLAAGLCTAPFLRPRLLADTRPSWWEPGARAVPSLALLALVLFGRSLFLEVGPLMRVERDEEYGISIPVPLGWGPGANRFGQMAFFNGLPGAGRATFAAGAAVGEEPADLALHARAFVERHLEPSTLGPEVLRVTHSAPEPARMGERDALRMRVELDEPFGRTVLLAWFVPRGNLVYQLVFSYPDDQPRYGQVMEQMISQVRFEEPKTLRQARARALLFPNTGWAMGELGTVLQRMGEAWVAIHALELAVRAEPAEVPFRTRLALARLQAGEVEAGCTAAGDALLYAPADAHALEVDARCALAQGNPHRALSRLREARVHDPSNPRLQRAVRTLARALEDPGG